MMRAIIFLCFLGALEMICGQLTSIPLILSIPQIPDFPSMPDGPPFFPSKPIRRNLHAVSLVAQDSSSSSSSSDSNQSNALSLLTKSIAEFSVDLYEAVSSTKKGNFIVSPFSAQTALSLLYCGAGGDTATTMADALDFHNQSNKDIIAQYKRILTPLQDNPSLNIANAIYVMNNLTIQPTFLKKATYDFYAKIENIDFSQNVAAANTINNWVAEETHDKIKKLLSPMDLDGGTRAVLLNAIYFKGTWVHHFPLKRTRPAKFSITSKSSIQVPMMHVTANFKYNFVKQLNAQVIELPYNNSEVTMVLILPHEIDGLHPLQQKLKTFNLTQLESLLRNQKVVLSMPKFTIETSLKLNGPLDNLGFGIIFSDSADFTKMLTNKNGQSTSMEVSKVIQKAYIEVDESGATAAAATAIIARPGMAAPPRNPPPRFVANHPFILLLKTPIAVLFMGTYTGH